MDPIWTQLPTDLALKIIGHLDDIDTRLAFKVPPRRLVLDKNFEFRSEIVYDPISRILFQFENQLILIRKNINLSVVRPGPLYVFNMEWDPYDLTIHVENHTFGPIECCKHVVTNKKVKFLLRYGPKNLA
jgi:hypothetical protein